MKLFIFLSLMLFIFLLSPIQVEATTLNDSCSVAYNVTITNTFKINRTGEILRLNLTGLYLKNNNATEMIFYNDTPGSPPLPMTYHVVSNETTIPPKGSQYALVDIIIPKITNNRIKQDITILQNCDDVGNNVPYGNLVTNSTNTYNTTGYSGVFNLTGGNWKYFLDMNGIAWKTPILNDNNGDFPILIKNETEPTKESNYLRSSAGSVAELSSASCNEISCSLNFITLSKTWAFINWTLYEYYIDLKITNNGTQNDKNHTFIPIVNLNASSNSLCTYNNNICTSPPISGAPSDIGYIINTSGYNIVKWIFKNETSSGILNTNGQLFFLDAANYNYPTLSMNKTTNYRTGFIQTDGQGNFANSKDIISMFLYPSTYEIGDSYSIFSEDDISECYQDSFNVTAFNFTMMHEENSTYINGTIDIYFNVTEKKLGITNTITNIYSFSTTPKAEHYFCIAPNSTAENYFVNVTLVYNATGTEDRWYYLTNTDINSTLATNNSIDINLYTILSSDASYISFNVKDTLQSPISSVIIKVLRSFPENNEFKTVAMGITGDTGVVAIPVKAYGYYKFIGERFGVVIGIKTMEQITKTSHDVVFDMLGGDGDTITDWFGSVTVLCSYNEVAEIISCTISDTSGYLQAATLTTIKKMAFGSFTTVCSDTSTENNPVLICDASGQTANSSMQYTVYGTFSGITYSLYSSFIDSTTGVLQWGNFGLFAAMLIIIVSSLAASWSPTSAIIGCMMGVLFSFALGLFNTGLGASTVIISLFIAGGIIIWRTK